VAVEIVMPAMEMAQAVATFVEWLKTEGEAVRKGEPLMLIETDKVSVEIEAPASGILANLTARAGDEVPVGQVIGLVLEPDAMQLKESKAATGGSDPGQNRRLSAATPLARRIAAEHALDPGTIPDVTGRVQKADMLAYLQPESSTATVTHSSKLKPASPKARSLAAEHDLALEGIAGSGEGGAILVADVERTVEQHAQERLSAQAPLLPELPAYRTIPLSGARRLIADRTQASYQSAPHIALTLSVDMSEARRLVEHLSPTIQAEIGHALTMTAVIAKFVGSSLTKHRRLNAHVLDGEIHEFDSVLLGVAVAIADGLVVPVIRQIEAKGLAAIQSELNDLTDRARNRSLKLSEIKGSTFTISNLGMYGVEQFTAILNAPEAGILSIGKIQDTPVGREGQIVLRPIMQVTLNADHRAVDGALAAAFLQTLQQTLENPYTLLG
jgi:pyruvate dehydrogenase E2 component (dihydrolipoamide acetyltransferase)